MTDDELDHFEADQEWQEFLETQPHYERMALHLVLDWMNGTFPGDGVFHQAHSDPTLAAVVITQLIDIIANRIATASDGTQWWDELLARFGALGGPLEPSGRR